MSTAQDRWNYNLIQCRDAVENFRDYLDDRAVVWAGDEIARLRDGVERLANLLFSKGAMEDAPCFMCGYNGSGYFNPDSHPCATRHHARESTGGKDHLVETSQAGEGLKV